MYAVLAVAGIVVVVAPAVLLLVQAFGGFTAAVGVTVLVVFFGAIVVGLGLMLVLLPPARAMQRRELEAGYTTLMPQFDDVDGIDPRTGLVVRPAIKRPPGATPDGLITTGMELGGIDTGRTPLQISLRVKPANLGELIAVVVLLTLIVAFVSIPDENTWLGIAIVVLAALAFASVIAIPITVLTYAPAWYDTARLSAVASGARAFAVGDVGDIDVVTELAGVGAASLAGARLRSPSFVVCEPSRLVMYSRRGTELVPFLLIPRSRIAAGRVGQATNVNGPSLPAPVLTVLKDNGSTVDLTLALLAPSMTSGKRRFQVDSQWIVDWAHARLTMSRAES